MKWLRQQKKERMFNEAYEEARQATHAERVRRQAADEAKQKAAIHLERYTRLARLELMNKVVDQASRELVLEAVEAIQAEFLSSLDLVMEDGLQTACREIVEEVHLQVAEEIIAETALVAQDVVFDVVDELAVAVADEARTRANEQQLIAKEQRQRDLDEIRRKEVELRAAERARKEAHEAAERQRLQDLEAAERAKSEAERAERDKEREAKRAADQAAREAEREAARLKLEEQRRLKVEEASRIAAEEVEEEVLRVEIRRVETEERAKVEAERARIEAEEAARVEAERLAVEALVEELRSTGFAAGDAVYNITKLPVTLSNGSRLVYGDRAVVLGLPMAPALRGGKGVALCFGEGIKANLDRAVDSLSPEKPPPLPGGYKPGDPFFFTGRNYTFPSGQRVLYGAHGEVLGPAQDETGTGGSIMVVFAGSTTPTKVETGTISLNPPTPLPGGFLAGQTVYFKAHSRFLPSGEYVLFGAVGEVQGPAVERNLPRKGGPGIAVRFDNRTADTDVQIALLSYSKQKMPGSFRSGATVYYRGYNRTITEPDSIVAGEYLLYGAKGEVVGPVLVASARGETVTDRVAVLWDSIASRALDTEFSVLTPTALPPLPGGLLAGTMVYYQGPSRTLPGTDITLEHGERGEVVGPPGKTLYAKAAERVAVRFDRRTGGDHLDMYVTALKADGKPPPKPREVKGAPGDSFKRSGRIRGITEAQ